jgi:hypothetical protein
MPKTRGYEAKSSLLHSIAAILSSNIKEKKIQSVPVDIKRFLDDVAQLPRDGVKNFSPERSIKLRGAFVAFLSINNIEKTPEIEEFLSELNSIKTLGQAAVFFSKAYDEIYLMLDKYPFREFLEAKLYFIDDIARKELIRINDELNALISNQNEKRKLKLNKIVNFLNPENASSRYSVSYKAKYQYISKEESLEKYLPAHYEITLNKIEKEYRDLFAAHKFSEKKKQQLIVKKEQEIQRVKDEFAYISKKLKDGKGFDVKILSYEHSSLYPEIKFSETSFEQGKTKHKTRYAHLRSEVVNALWYKPSQLKSSNTVADILQNYNHAFGDVYYIEEELR